uniref:Zinc-finger homeodomain protein 6 n=1 Tax=Noccaea caerulescens TaxID=107243 RepID=A0A1J3GYZ7_NOCCA
MEVREKKKGDEKMEMARRKSSADHRLPPYTYPQIADKEKPTTNRIVSGPDPDPDLDSNPILVAPVPRSYAMPQTTSPTRSVRYRECQRNHAASSGGHVIDGCGEFMPTGEEGTAESLLCAACDCHRSFHRKEMDGMFVVKFNSFGPSQRPLVSRHVSPIMMSFGGGGVGGGRDPAESSTEDLNKLHHQSFSGNGVDQFHQYHPKKRFRTKFNQEQKEKMMEFAEKIGWRMNKQEDEEVNRFCREINVKRQVFKVWMHNNKPTKKKDNM